MIGYITGRLLQGLFLLMALSVLVFVLIRTTGDPVGLLLPPGATKDQETKVVESLGLDKPYAVQYWNFAKGIVRLDFGDSIRSHKPVTSLIRERFPNSVKLAVGAIIFALVFSLPLGIAAAYRKDSIWDLIARGLAALGQSLPLFWFGIIMIHLFSVRLGLLPAGGIGGAESFVLPCVTLGIFSLAGFVRLIRSSMLEVLDEDYIRLSRLKGLSEWIVVWKHALRNAISPVLSFGGVMFAVLIEGAVVVEVVFSLPGIGRLVFEGITGRDFPVVHGTVLAVAAVVVLVNWLVDILHAVVDPRIRVSGVQE
jgi:ABC-type dipeptide/oligopeptide/nickel transport system permease component